MAFAVVVSNVVGVVFVYILIIISIIFIFVVVVVFDRGVVVDVIDSIFLKNIV